MSAIWLPPALILGLGVASSAGGTPQNACLRGKVEGMLVGSMIGDAAGGPIEFAVPERTRWSDSIIDSASLAGLAASFHLRPYTREPSAYGIWIASSPAGTTTDETRHKLIVMRVLRAGHEPSAAELARAYVDYWRQPVTDAPSRLRREWLDEVGRTALWTLGRPESEGALPPDRLWGGLATVSGQMALLPIAALFPGQPEKAYRAAWRADFMETGAGKDYTAAIVAGLSRALDCGQPPASWAQVEAAIRDTDPYGFARAPWAGRELDRWLDYSHEAARQSGGVPERLYAILDSGLKARVWWEAWVPLVLTFSVADLAKDAPLAAMEIVLEFGHDADSDAHLMGAFLGAINGASAFPGSMRRAVDDRLRHDYGVGLDDWLDSLGLAKPAAAPIVLLDARSASERRTEPVEGAAGVQWQDFNSSAPSLQGLLLPDPNVLARKLQSLGVAPGRRIIVVGDGTRGWGEEGRIAWMMSYLGVKDVQVLGIRGAQELLVQGLKTNAGAAAPWRPSPDERLRARKKDIIEIVVGRQARPAVIDVRSEKEFAGRKTYGESRAGHIPGSCNIPWTSFVGSDGSPLPRRALHQLLRSHGIDPARPLIFYCTGGVRSGYAAFAAEKVGLDARNYDGSFWEWSADRQLPVAR